MLGFWAGADGFVKSGSFGMVGWEADARETVILEFFFV